MNAVLAQLATLRTRSNNLRIHNFMLQDLVNMFERRVEAFEGREEDHGVLREALLQMVRFIVSFPVNFAIYCRVWLDDQKLQVTRVCLK